MNHDAGRTDRSSVGQGREQKTPRHIDLCAHCDGAHLHITVAYGGPGMAAAIAQHILEPFFTTKPLGHGTDSGVSVCKTWSKRIEGP